MKSVEEVPVEDAVVVEEGEQTNMRQVWLFGRSDRRMDFTLQPGCRLGALREMWLFTRHWEE